MKQTTSKKLAIAGFGTEGQALYEYFKKTHQIYIFDEQARSPQGGVLTKKKFGKAENPERARRASVGLSNVHFHQTLTIPADFEIVYKSPGIPLKNLKLKNPKTQISSLTNLFFEKAQGTIIGVTGTKGKSTTSSLIHHILKKSGFNSTLIGNIGATGLQLLKKDKPSNFYVYELSSYQCELLKKSPHIAVVTNLYQDHLSNHGSFKNYKKAKANIARFQTGKDFLVINSEVDFRTATQTQILVDPQTLRVICLPKIQQLPKKKIKPGMIIPLPADQNTLLENLKQLFPNNFQTKLPGHHNQFNCLLAYITARLLNIPHQKIIAAIKTFKPLPGRLEKIATRKGITFYEDYLATIPEATWAAIQSLPKIDTIILGGQDRGIKFEEFARQLTTTKIRNFIIFPDTGKKMVTHVARLKGRKIIPAKNMEEAVRTAYAHTRKNGICLLSTASPSFNMFKNYQDRSEQYRYWIRELSN